MRVVLQRVTSASVSVEGKLKSKIGHGLLILLGIEESDTDEDIKWLSKKICMLRIFYNENQVKDLSLLDVEGDILLVSQFTLHARVKKGNRPAYVDAAKPEIALPLYHKFIEELENHTGREVATGEFGAYMQVTLVNDGPVTITIDSKNRV